MKQKLKYFLAGMLSLQLLSACEDNTVHIVYPPEDSTKKAAPFTYKSTYGGSIPGLGQDVPDYTSPDPYQNKRQVFLDSTVCMSWTMAGFPNAKRFINFIKHFQWDVKDRNKEKIASLIAFPIKGYKTKEYFLSHFDSIFAPDFVDQVQMQNPQEIYRNERGAMIGNDGQIWFKPRGGSYVIVDINP